MNRKTPEPVRVKLKHYDYLSAAMAGSIRHIASVEAGLKDKHGFNDQGRYWDIAIEGACGEVVVANYLEVYWHWQPGQFKGPDIGKDIQVRTTRKHDYGLIVRPADPEDDVYVLVTGMSPDFVIRGWIEGKIAKQEKYMMSLNNSRPPAYIIPQTDLHPIKSLKERLNYAGIHIPMQTLPPGIHFEPVNESGKTDKAFRGARNEM